MRLFIAFTLCVAVFAQTDDMRCVILLDVYNRSDYELRNLTRFTDKLLEAFANPGDKVPGKLNTAMIEFGRNYSHLHGKDALVHTVMNFTGPPVKHWASNVTLGPPVVADTMPHALRKAQEMITEAKTLAGSTVNVIMLVSKGRPSMNDGTTTARKVKQQGTKIFTISPIFPTGQGLGYYLPSSDVFLVVNMFASDESFARSSEEILIKAASLVNLPTDRPQLPSTVAPTTTPPPRHRESRYIEILGITGALCVLSAMVVVATIFMARKVLRLKGHKKHKKHGKGKKRRGVTEGEEEEPFPDEEYPAEFEETTEGKEVELKEGTERTQVEAQVATNEGDLQVALKPEQIGEDDRQGRFGVASEESQEGHA